MRGSKGGKICVIRQTGGAFETAVKVVSESGGGFESSEAPLGCWGVDGSRSNLFFPIGSLKRLGVEGG